MAIEKRPAADRLRPVTFDEMAGQEKLVGKNGILRRLAEGGVLPSVIFYGPPGTGKTTAAGILAELSGKEIFYLNATTATLSDVKEVAAMTGSLIGCSGVVLYLDEIQYFNKKQQQSLLSYIEDGSITLIASTTENPYYYVYDALLSRCSVFEFRPVSDADIEKRLRQVAPQISETVKISDGALRAIARSAAGDVRRAVNMLELAFNVSDNGEITEDELAGILPSVSLGSFDRDGDVHYDLLSALQKSIRGSDPDAAVFYLARLLEGGDIISPCRRLQVIASEDIGQAYPMAAVITRACCESAKELGLPEAAIPLSNAAVMLATAPKSNTSNEAYSAAAADVKAGAGREIPTHLRSPLFKGYKYPHSYPNRYVKQQYLPDDLKDRKYYKFGENKTEQAAKTHMEKIRGIKKEEN
ncbi:MAG: replication-associated recombination protein A [Clostridia bacterium]|nr:replication-associated recombination protein A [Clostridia bacterium]